MSVRVFVEGRTEETVIHHLKPIIGRKVLPVNVRGKRNFPPAISDRLGPALDEPGGARFVILRDQDRDERLEDIQRSFQGAIQRAFSEEDYDIPVQLAPHSDHANIFTFQVQRPMARFAIHVAQPSPDVEGWRFSKSTTDDYVLALALLSPVAERFIGRSKAQASPADLRRKVLQEVPELFSDNGIPLSEAKDLVGIYMATARFLATQRSEQPETFAGIVVDRARKYAEAELKRVLASILEAVEFVVK